MSSRKKTESHNIFDHTELQKQPKHDEALEESYADNEKMTIPRFNNQVARDSGWSQRTDTR